MDFRAALLDQTREFGQLIRGADPSTPVPTCPDWTLKQLFRHVGRGNRWAAQIIADRRLDPLDPRDVRDGKPPDDLDGAIDWLNKSAELIIDAVDRVGPETRVWTFLGPRPCGWWIRRRLHEATVHRADTAIALGVGYELSPEIAADAISEWIERVSVEARPRALPLAVGRTLHLHATDDGLGPTGEWTITSDTEDGITWSHSHGKGDVALRGQATDLLLAVVRRRTAADVGIEVFGDATVWEGWLEHTPF
ncbi:maleylpyruvate isomerase family mycothiol-dependent enzyme [Mycobacterium sp. NPDC048908]|uniref:maleylpyruvate isomerase family mycothiol-dependent enzyme n=1 Tax=Mycobacterium sp. NPDC048908 TaxID=3364292 RepID=UPI0037182AE7